MSAGSQVPRIYQTCFPAVATGLVAVGFAESVAHLFDTESVILTKLIAIGTLGILTAVNSAGVSWVVRLQLLLLGFLGLAVLDFFVGAVFSSDIEHGVYALSTDRLRENSLPHYSTVNCSSVGIERVIPQQSFFTVFGVFFANFLGVLAGVNMSGDLKDPHKNIPLGELSAVGVSSTICFFFIMILGATAERMHLICDNLIEEKVSLTGVVFMLGLYICSLSSTIGSLLGTPRVLQGIAAEGIIPALMPLAQGSGPNKNPVLAGMVLMAVASVFVLLGDLNELAILSTMPFLITYAFVNYSYVSLAMSYDLATINRTAYEDQPSTSSYGAVSRTESDLNELFPERQMVNIESASEIVSQPATWYAMFSNRYIAFVGFLVNLLILLFINFNFAIAHFVFWLCCISTLEKSVQHARQEFPLSRSPICSALLSLLWRQLEASIEDRSSDYSSPFQQGAKGPETTMTTQQLNEENADYGERKKYHHADNLTEQFDWNNLIVRDKKFRYP